jgi:hypothetical protein
VTRTPTGRALLLMCLHVIAGAIIVVSGEAFASEDFSRYYEIGSTPGRPYIEFPVEHAPLTLGLFRLLARTTGSRRGFGVAMVAIDVAANLLIAFTLAYAFGWTAAVAYLTMALMLLAILDTRFDLLPTAAATLAMAAHVRRKPAASMIALVGGAGFKLWPLCLTALVIGREDARGRRRAVVALAGAAALLGAVWLAVGGAQGVVQVLTFRGATGWQIESLGGLLLALRGLDGVRMESGAFRIGQVAPWESSAMLALAATIALSVGWLSKDSRRIGVVWIASISALLIFSPLLSPQFMVWLAPAAAIAWREEDRTPAILTGAVIGVTALFMTGYSFVIAGRGWALGLVLARNILLIALFVTALRAAVSGRQAASGNLRVAM